LADRSLLLLVNPSTFTLPDSGTLVTRYQTFLATQETRYRPCPQCQGWRARHGWRARNVLGAPGQWGRLALLRLRCRPCHTVETVFPPWLLPYESWTVPVWDAVLTAVATEGQSWRRIATDWQVEVTAVKRRWRRWEPQLPAFRHQVHQVLQTWQIGTPWRTWHPPPAARAADWGRLQLCWQAVALVLGAVWELGTPTGFVTWRTWVPTGLPGGVLPRHTHLRRRLGRTPAGFPP